MKPYTNIYWKKRPNNRLIKKKNQTICSITFKGGTRRKPIGFVIKLRIILTKHNQLYTIAIVHCYHQSMLPWVSFLKAKALKKASSFSKLSNLLFILVLKRGGDWISFSVLPIRLFHVAGPLMEIRNLHLRNLIYGFL